jgi:MFS transporter, CP family, cyanate transporter
MLGGVWLIYYCFGLTAAAMAPLVRPITRDLGMSHAAMGAVFGAWPLVYIASAVPCGAFLDRYGPRSALFLGAAAIGVSGLLRALAGDQLTLYLAVAVFGVGGPLVSIGAPKLIGRWFEGKERGLAMGLYVTGPALGNITALSLTNRVMMPLLGGSWRAVLLVYAAFVLAAGAAWLVISGHAVRHAADPGAGADLRPPQLEVFLALVRARAVQIVLLLSVGVFFFNHGLNNWLPEILRSRGMDAQTADAWAVVPAAVGLAGALVVPRLAVPARRIAVLLALFTAAGTATLLIQAPAASALAAGLVLQGIARGSMMSVSVLVLMETREVGPSRFGAAGGLFFSAAEIGGVLGPLTVGVLYDLTGGFGASLTVLTAVCLALVALLGPLGKSIRSPGGPGWPRR